MCASQKHPTMKSKHDKSKTNDTTNPTPTDREKWIYVLKKLTAHRSSYHCIRNEMFYRGSVHGHPSTSTDVHGRPWTSMDVHGRQWTFLDAHERPWTSGRNYRTDNKGFLHNIHICIRHLAIPRAQRLSRWSKTAKKTAKCFKKNCKMFQKKLQKKTKAWPKQKPFVKLVLPTKRWFKLDANSVTKIGYAPTAHPTNGKAGMTKTSIIFSYQITTISPSRTVRDGSKSGISSQKTTPKSAHNSEPWQPSSNINNCKHQNHWRT